jgi:hypothetical protein
VEGFKEKEVVAVWVRPERIEAYLTFFLLGLFLIKMCRTFYDCFTMLIVNDLLFKFDLSFHNRIQESPSLTGYSLAISFL